VSQNTRSYHGLDWAIKLLDWVGLDLTKWTHVQLCVNIHGKFYGDRPRGTPLPGELNTRGVAKYSDFGPINGYISETVMQDRRYKLVLITIGNRI